MNDHDTRFGGISRLYGRAGMERLRTATVCVVGVGGVGSWAVEALARSGIGAITLVDLDDICVSNVNRQLHAMDGEFGRLKVDVMAGRIRAINPECRIQAVHAFFNETTQAQLFAGAFDFLIDAIDKPIKKALLIAACRERGVPILVTGGAGGRRDPTAIRVADLARVTHDRLLQQTRTRLRKSHAFPRGGRAFDVPCVFSPEPIVYPGREGTTSKRREPGSSLRLNCESGYGTAAFVTGAFGLVAAAHVVRHLAERV
ncbi:MAG: tRNA threonylcarbamoyladenosine dehydratase [Verrucomicrobiota bacterium]